MSRPETELERTSEAYSNSLINTENLSQRGKLRFGYIPRRGRRSRRSRFFSHPLLKQDILE